MSGIVAQEIRMSLHVAGGLLALRRQRRRVEREVRMAFDVAQRLRVTRNVAHRSPGITGHLVRWIVRMLLHSIQLTVLVAIFFYPFLYF